MNSDQVAFALRLECSMGQAAIAWMMLKQRDQTEIVVVRSQLGIWGVVLFAILGDALAQHCQSRGVHEVRGVHESPQKLLHRGPEQDARGYYLPRSSADDKAKFPSICRSRSQQQQGDIVKKVKR